MEEFKTKIPVVRKPKLEHLNRQIAPLAHTPMYNWHKFWSRKTWNVVAKFIQAYCPSGGVVLDPFAGSGVTILEALRHGRRAIASDVLPVSTELMRLTIKPVQLERLTEAYERVSAKVKDKILRLYMTRCRNCECEFPFTCAIWTQQRAGKAPISRRCTEVRYLECPNCHDRRDSRTRPLDIDKQRIDAADAHEIREWYPTQKLYHANGKPFKEKQRFESVDELFTKRNLWALALLMHAIEEEPSRDLKDFLKIGFSSMVHLCTTMTPVRPTRPFSSAWTQHSYWFAGEFMELNVWDRFESAILGKQGLIAAKRESNRYFRDVRFASSWHEVIEGRADVFIHRGSCFDLMGDMQKSHADGCVDYIFTDPPYDASVQYGELAYLWVTWLKMDKGYLEDIAANEVIRNERQEKDFDVYHSLLQRSFQDMFHVLKPDAYLTVTFHNPTFEVRNATIRAGVFSGFELQKIHHQELARPSAKSLIQPFGSAQGDFYLRFYKAGAGEKPLQPAIIDEMRFTKIVMDTTVKVMAERGEPTPYTIIINAVDPELARQGYFSELHSGLDVKHVLQRHVDSEFVLVPAKLGDAEGKLWWLKTPSIVPHLESVPLSERVERTVLRKLQQRGRVTFTEMWDAVSTEFPNALTSDSMSIVEALKIYAHEVAGGFWMLKPDFAPAAIDREHSRMIATLAEIGKARGYRIWVGKVEQSHAMPTFLNKKGTLRRYVTIKGAEGLQGIHNTQDVEGIDLLWVADKRIVSLFEIESTTSMTSALVRGSNVEPSVPKFLVTPEEREAQFLRKLKSPMFAERFADDNWKVLYFRALGEEFLRHKGKTNIDALVDKKIMKAVSKQRKEQLSLFGRE